ncbi:cytochrome c oxidase assembly protein [Jiangella ureilytica]|uniref:Cytochrome c oxidase assembly protein n=1 Tax=Jiangella ureilytica TaxID=2530374 RepID=A0A4R4RMU8_9ACTN|nr:cytochrome c oxidase assembly protein [Jiangella ureilytica]
MGVLGHAQHEPDAALAGWLPAVLLVFVLVVSYLLAVGRFTRRTLRGWPRARTAAFAGGAVLIALGVSPPVHALAAGDLRGHVLQHLLLGMYAPVALVLAAPMTLVLAALPATAARTATSVLRLRPVRVLTHPVSAGLMTVAGMYALYFTPLYGLSARDAVLAHAVHIHVLITGSVFVWSIAGPGPAPARPRMRLRVAVLVGVAGAHAYLAKLLYARADTSPPGAGLDPDQVRQAAQLMYYGGDVAELVVAIALFAGAARLRVPAGNRTG